MRSSIASFFVELIFHRHKLYPMVSPESATMTSDYVSDIADSGETKNLCTNVRTSLLSSLYEDRGKASLHAPNALEDGH